MAEPTPKPTGRTGVLTGPQGDVYVRDGEAYLRDRKTGQLGAVPEANIADALSSGRFAPVSSDEVDEHYRIKGLQEEMSGIKGAARAFGEGALRAAGDTALLPVRGIHAALGGDQADIPTAGQTYENILGAEEGEKSRIAADVNEGAAMVGGLLPDAAAMAFTGGGSTAIKSGLKLGLLKRVERAALREGTINAVGGASYASEDAWRRGESVTGEDILRDGGIGALIGGGLGGIGEAAAHGISRGTDILTGPGGRDALRKVSGGLRDVASAQEALTPSFVTRGHRGRAARAAAGVLDRVLPKTGDAALDAVSTAELMAARDAQKVAAREADSLLSDLGRREKAAARTISDAERIESRLTDDLARHDATMQSRTASSVSKAEREIEVIQKQAQREANAGAAELSRAQKLLAKSELAAEKAGIEASPAMAKAEAALEKARVAERAATDAQKARGIPQEKLSAARAEVKARESELRAVQQRYAVKDREHGAAIRAAKDGVESAKARIQSAKVLEKEGTAARRAQLEQTQKALGEAADYERRAISGRLEGARNAAREGRESLAQHRQQLQEAALGRQTMLEGQGPAMRAMEAEKYAQATAQQDEAWRRSFGYSMIQKASKAGQRYARAAFRPGILAGAYGSLPSAWGTIQEAKVEQKIAMDDAILKAAGGLPGRWESVSGVGDYQNYPNGQFQQPGESRREAFYARQAEVSQMTSNPALLLEKLMENTAELAKVAPDATVQVTESAMRGVEWLSQFQYGTKQTVDPFMPGDTDAPVSDDDISTYERVWNATMFPGAIIDKLALWQLDEETIATANQVHPETVQKLKSSLAEAITTGELKPTYQQRLQLSALFSLPAFETTPEVQGRLMMYAQSQAAPEQEKTAEKPGRPVGSPTMAQQYQTVSQKAANPGA
jgi:hypothetical protein